jgi:hypothetical protein
MQNRIRWLLVAALGGVASASLSVTNPTPASAAPAPAAAAACPMEVPGTTVQMIGTDDGVALVFRTTGDVGMLRHLVKRMAIMHNQSEIAKGEPAARGTPRGAVHPTVFFMLPPSQATAVEIDGGASLVLTPRWSHQLTELRRQARRHADALTASRRCPLGGAPQPIARR